MVEIIRNNKIKSAINYRLSVIINLRRARNTAIENSLKLRQYSKDRVWQL